MNPSAHHPLPESCPNCAAAVAGPYCSQCGQETIIEAPTLHEFLHEYLHHYIALEGRLWRSIWLLVRYPGKLTTEFLAGRRRRFVRPLPLYITVSFLFFLLTALFPTHNQFEVNDHTSKSGNIGRTVSSIGQTTVDEIEKGLNTANQGPAVGASKADDPNPETLITAGTANLSYDGKSGKFLASNTEGDNLQPIADRLNRVFQHFRTDPEQSKERFMHVFWSKLPYAIFGLLPLFAFGSWVLHLGRHRTYGEHVLTALHLHAFVFLTLLATYWIPIEGIMWCLPVVWWGYTLLAIRRIFGGNLFMQAARASMLILGQFIALSVATLFVVVFAALEV